MTPTNNTEGSLDSLDEIFLDWVWTTKISKIVVNEKPAYAIFKNDLPRFKAALTQLITREKIAELRKVPRADYNTVDEYLDYRFEDLEALLDKDAA